MKDQNNKEDQKLEDLMFKFLDKHYPISEDNVLDKNFDTEISNLLHNTFNVIGSKVYHNWLLKRIGAGNFFTVTPKYQEFPLRVYEVDYEYTPMRLCKLR